MDLVRGMMILTIENGWEEGYGPGGLAYGVFNENDFWLL
jgi:hypothetical protein